MRAAGCRAAAETDPILREHPRDCARERTWHVTTDTILGCANGLGEAVVAPLKAVVGGVVSFYDHFANHAALRARAVQTCFTSDACREKIAAQAHQPPGGTPTRDEFEKTWLVAQRATSIQNLDLQRRSLETQRDLVFRGLRPGDPAYEAALEKAPPGVADHLRRVVDKNVGTATPLVDLVTAQAQRLYQHTQCLDQRAATELICYSALLVAVPGEAAAYLAGSKILTKMVTKGRAGLVKAESRAAVEAKPSAPAPREAPPPPAPAAAPAAEVARDIVGPSAEYQTPR